MGKRKTFCIKLAMLGRWWLYIWKHFWLGMLLAFVLTMACQVIWTLLIGEGAELF
jgi:hypothetical protein